jgi:hypothetical protein
MCDSLNKYLKENAIISRHQFGFQKNKNTTQALLSFVNEVQRDIESENHSLAIYIDLTKAFDTVNHEILLKKMERYGIRGVPLQWFNNYLYNRQQFIQSGELSSNIKITSCGVPQGSNLGPVLFLLYVNDLPQALVNATPSLFADDTTLRNSGRNARELRQKMNEDLEIVAMWFIANKLTLNISKTNGCHFRPRNSQKVTGIHIAGQEIEMHESVKYLGIYVDEKLSWSDHINKLTQKVNMYSGILGRIRSSLDNQTLRTIYMSLVHSVITYGIELWGCAFPTTLRPLITAQKKLIRVISKTSYRHSTSPLFCFWKIRPIKYEIHLRHSLLSYDIVRRGNRSLEVITEHTHNYPTRFSKTNLPLPRTRTRRQGTSGILNTIVKSYNNLPDDIKDIPIIQFRYFKAKLSEHIYGSYS